MLATLLLLPIRTRIAPGLFVGSAAGLLSAPFWLAAIGRFRGARPLYVLMAVAVLCGCWLSWMDSTRMMSRGMATEQIGLLLLLAVGLGALLCARIVLSLRAMTIAFGIGMLVNGRLNPGDLTETNIWKFALVVPVAIIVLGWVSGQAHRGRQLLALVCLAAACALADARSYLGTFVLAAVVIVWQMRPRAQSAAGWWGWSVGMVGALSLGVYQLARALLLDGYLGQEAQDRSVEQVRSGGSLLLGGRPEMAATLRLARLDPWGHGLGAEPSLADVNAARDAMYRQLGQLPDKGYLENFMFGSGFELHSVLGDLWAWTGVGGVLLSVVMGGYIVRGVAGRLVLREADALLLFLCLWSCWNLLFSPFYSALPTLMLALALVLPRREPVASQDPPPDATSSPSTSATPATPATPAMGAVR